jgi:hypothetical protein
MCFSVVMILGLNFEDEWDKKQQVNPIVAKF